MRALVGAVLTLAGAVLFAAGIIVDGINKNTGDYGAPGYVLGGCIGLVGIIILIAAAFTRE